MNQHSNAKHLKDRYAYYLTTFSVLLYHLAKVSEVGVGHLRGGGGGGEWSDVWHVNPEG